MKTGKTDERVKKTRKHGDYFEKSLATPLWIFLLFKVNIVKDHWLPLSRLMFPFDSITAHSCLTHQILGHPQYKKIKKFIDYNSLKEINRI